MPRVFKAIKIEKEEKEIKKDYLDRHMPHIICDDVAKRDQKFKVKVRMGDQYPHPDDYDHYIHYIQLWNRETMLASVQFTPGAQGSLAGHVEIDFYIIPKMSMNLSAMALCTKHGLWQSESKDIKVTD